MDISFADKASQKMILKAADENIETVWDRYEAQQPQCGFGTTGLCCRHCTMGPCRIDPFGEGPSVGVCGANADTFAARHVARMVAGGSAAHSDHGLGVVETLLAIAEDDNSAYEIKNVDKLYSMAKVYDIEIKNKEPKVIAKELANIAFEEFGRQRGELILASLAPEARQKLWRDKGIMPRGIYREVVETMHRTTMGVDADYKNIIKHSMRTALSDGWGGSMLATELQDIIFGVPTPLKSSANLGVLKEDEVNILVHGHEPTLSDIIADLSTSDEINKLAEAKGAKGVNVAGICCTANEILMRRGVPLAGSFLQQELAIVTGVADLMIVDVQCIMPSLKKVTEGYHTELITTSHHAKMDGVKHVAFHPEEAVKTAKEIITIAIDNYPNRNKEQIDKPDDQERLVAGFTADSISKFLGGKYRSTYRPLNDAIISGRIRGAAGVVGCSNPNSDYEKNHILMVKELLKNDVIVVTTGCNAITCAKHGLLQPEAAFKYAGEGLQEICRTVGIPPVLHLGSCVDNSRILTVLTNVVNEGGLGNDISDLPAAGAAPEWMSEKAVAIGMYFVASGVYTLIDHPLPVMGSKKLHQYLTEDIEQDVGGKWAFQEDPVKGAHMMIRHIDKKRKALKLKPLMYEQSLPVED
ncbi:MAG: anaerobic carbon-monoxide dehydrogenase catalytic subunit [Deltaproteobacteria bacterium]|jgi:anaerobic carbon-monoxide dehydrogenase catalytic subunit|nr:anaerobic carbon-monoxide dehydrogenase catalytic subunit [Deltaproteobacteria bacterium]